MTRHLRCALIALAALPALLGGQAAPAPARLAPYRARLLGVFNLEGEPIEGAEVSDAMSHMSALTTKTGTVVLTFLPDGGSLVRIQKIGYAPQTIMVAISPADTVPFTIILKSAAQTLPTVVTKDSAPHYISPALRAFEDRRRRGFGKFVTEAEMRKNDNLKVTSVVRNMGVKVACTPRTPIKCFATSSRVGGTGFCDFLTYVDGIPMTGDMRDLEQMRADQYAAAEAYMGPATIPVEYNLTGSVCGVLLLWSRER